MIDRQKAKKAIILFAALSTFSLFASSLMFAYFFWLDQSNEIINSKFTNAQFLATFTFIFTLILGLFVVIVHFMSAYLRDYDDRIIKGKEIIIKSKHVDQSAHEFVSMASHQMRSPLIAMKWLCKEILKKSKNLTKDDKNSISTVRELADRVIQLVDALLNVSRLDAGVYKFKLEEFDLVDVIEDVTKEFKMRLKEKNVSLKKKLSRKNVKVLSDRKSVDFVLENLISNAIKYSSPKGKIWVYVDYIEKETVIDEQRIPRHSCVIRIVDNGLGIPENQQEYVFEKLFRADNAKYQNIEGTGLGLYCIKKIVEALNGEIWFESEEGQGSTFYVSIPVKFKKPKLWLKVEKS